MLSSPCECVSDLTPRPRLCPGVGGPSLRCRPCAVKPDLKEIAMENRWCSACGRAFLPRPQAPRQSYCTRPECRRERRRIWQLAKRQTDPDYLLNQTRAQQAWAARNPDYWRQYRQEHPEYAERNRVRQRDRRQLRKRTEIAKMVASDRPFVLEAGTYRLVRLDPESDANMDAWTVHLTVLSRDT